MIRFAAIALIAGFGIVLIASIVGPGQVYAEPGPGARLAIIQVNRTVWVVSNLLFALGGLVTAGGALALWAQPRAADELTLAMSIGAFAFTAGAVAWSLYLGQRIVDPASYLYVDPMPPTLTAFAILSVVGLLGMGWGWLQTSLPAWPAHLTLAVDGLIVAAAVLSPAWFYASFPPQVIDLFTLMMGDVLLRH